MGASSSRSSDTSSSCTYSTSDCHMRMRTEVPFLKLPVKKASIANNNCNHICDDSIDQWNIDTEIMWEVLFTTCGLLNIALGLSGDKHSAGATIEVSVGGSTVRAVTKSKRNGKVFMLKVGSVTIKSLGILTIRVKAVELKNQNVGQLHFLFLSGPAVKEATLQEIPNRIDTVALQWETGTACDLFYAEMTVTDTCRGAIFIACGFNGGYLGVRDNEFSNRRGVVFCVHDPKSGKDEENRSDPSPNQRVLLVDHSRNVNVERFGYGGTGMQSFYGYYWNRNEPHRFLLSAKRTNGKHYIIYTAYFFRNEISRWKKIASFKVFNDGRSMHSLFSSIEDYLGNNGRLQRRAMFGKVCIRTVANEWIFLTRAVFIHAGKLKNTNSGVSNDGQFYLCTGGNTKQTHESGEWLHSPTDNELPQILKNNHLDFICNSLS